MGIGLDYKYVQTQQLSSFCRLRGFAFATNLGHFHATNTDGPKTGLVHSSPPIAAPQRSLSLISTFGFQDPKISTLFYFSSLIPLSTKQGHRPTTVLILVFSWSLHFRGVTQP
jgi:hypothetical protein